MPSAEFFVRVVQRYVPTYVCRLLVRFYLKVYSGPLLRGGPAVVAQIAVDRHARGGEPVTAQTAEANDQHYGNDPAFFAAHLGPRLKYSACEYGDTDLASSAALTLGTKGGDKTVAMSLGDAEDATVVSYQRRGGLDALPAGAKILELGCGWGSLSLANAAKFPKLQFVGFSNSPQQIAHIEEQCRQRGLKNLTVFVEDYADFCTDRSKVAPGLGGRRAELFDGAFAIETIEHAKDIGTLLDAVAQRLKPGAKLFVHSLLHQTASYLVDSGDWMGRNFFTGGSILSLNSYFHLAPPSLHITEMVPVRGYGYARTLLAFLANLEREYKPLTARYGVEFVEGFRAFYIVCAEAFSANDGCEYMIGYYTFTKQ